MKSQAAKRFIYAVLMVGTLASVSLIGKSSFAAASVCGDGAIGSGETCDDGGTCSDNGAPCTTLDLSLCDAPETATCAPQNGDGCGNHCHLEKGFVCSGEPSACTPICGDGLTNGTEDCDDGGTCVGGSKDGQACTGDNNCPGGGTCQAQG